jgi:hypothetical protein
MDKYLGVALQSLGAVALVLGFAIWLGLAAAFLTFGVVLIVAGIIVEIGTVEVEGDERADEAD